MSIFPAVAPPEEFAGRLPPGELERLRAMMLQKGFRLPEAGEMENKLAELRLQYEPYVRALASRFHLGVPPWVRE